MYFFKVYKVFQISLQFQDLVNVDFAGREECDAISLGNAIMGMGKAGGEGRAITAAKQAIDSPLLENSVQGATGIVFNVTGGPESYSS